MVESERIVCLGPGAIKGLKCDRALEKHFTPWMDAHMGIVQEMFTCGMERTDELEHNTDFKQIIPYVILTRGSDVFWYNRGKGAGEQRLARKTSVGIGGHWKCGESFASSITREHNEEFGGIPLKDVVYGKTRRTAFESALNSNDYGLFSTLFCIGIVNDDSSSVGRVHLGVIVYIELTDYLKPSEGSELSGCTHGYASPIELLGHRVKGVSEDKLEPWSEIALMALIKSGLVK